VALCTDLHHTYLTQCLDSFVDDDSGRLGIVMPFYSGGDLSAVVKKNAARGTR
jgi:serine/threonine protein kinase